MTLHEACRRGRTGSASEIIELLRTEAATDRSHPRRSQRACCDRAVAGHRAGYPPRELSTSGSEGELDPTIELVAPSTGVFRLRLLYARRGTDAAQIRVARNHRADAIALLDLDADLPADAPMESFVDVFLAEDDRLYLTVRAPDPTDAPVVALAPWLAAEGDDPCLAAVDFDDWPTLPSQCGGITTVLLETGGGTVPTESTGPHPRFGSALRTSRTDNAYARLDGTEGLDLSGDFTVQLWARREELGPSSQLEAIFANAGDDPSGTELAGGLSLDYDGLNPGDAIEVSVFEADGDIPSDVTGFDPGAEWHFYRIVRRDEQVQLCIDGIARTDEFTAAGDLTSSRAVRLGRFQSMGVFFNGSIDEVVIFDEALPCAVPGSGAP